MARPPARVEVEVVLVTLRTPEDKISPPVIVRPWLEASPAAEIPPVKEDVAAPMKVEVPAPEVILPAMIASPVETFNPPLETNPTAVIPPANEEVPVVSTRRVPPIFTPVTLRVVA